ncbi:hypothetical protein EDB19DRAFT_774433 [Suillus lakei]|nr:hypothetical protein EDB19DRAFT_774433 [Suillus lakei]
MSNMPTTELVVFNTTEAYREDPSILYPVLDIGFQAEGAQVPAYTGLQIENPATGYMLINWDNKELHVAMMTTPLFEPLLKALKPVYEGSLDMNHIIFNDHTTAFQQPVTEVLILTLKNPSHRAEVFNILTKLSDTYNKLLAFGPTLEDDNKIVVVHGWPSVEAHWEAVADPELKAEFQRITALANRDHLFHTTLTPYSGKQQPAVEVTEVESKALVVD